MTGTRTFNVSFALVVAAALLAAAAVWASASLAGGPGGGNGSSDGSPRRSDGRPAFVQGDRENCPERAGARDSAPGEEPSV
jgi:hypothetical protein